MPDADRKDAVARRGAKLWRVLVAGGMALAAACAGAHKEGSSSSSTGSSGSDTGAASSTGQGSNQQGGGASGW